MWQKNKLNRKQRIDFAHLLGDLLENGFSLQQAFDFFLSANLFSKPLVTTIQQECYQGHPLADSFAYLSNY